MVRDAPRAWRWFLKTIRNSKLDLSSFGETLFKNLMTVIAELVPAKFKHCVIVLAICVLLLSCLGCKRFRGHIGPKTILADRVPYNNAIAHSWKEQTLLNIVKLRYIEPPFFIDVPQIVNGYSLDRSVNGTVGIQNASQPNIPTDERILGSLVGNAKWSDRPTITYSPQTGSQFIRNLTAPLPPEAILLLLEAGYAADAVFGLSVQSINGIRNKSAFAGSLRPADPEFRWIINIIREAQLSGDVGIRNEFSKTPDGETDQKVVIRFAETVSDPEIAEKISLLKQTLRLDADTNRFTVIYGDAPLEKDQIAIKTQPIYLVLRDLTPFVDVPAKHVNCGLAVSYDTSQIQYRPLHVRCGSEPPKCPFAAVCYRDCWFWIDHTEAESKRTFNYLVLLLALADTAPKQPRPTVTIQAN